MISVLNNLMEFFKVHDINDSSILLAMTQKLFFFLLSVLPIDLKQHKKQIKCFLDLLYFCTSGPFSLTCSQQGEEQGLHTSVGPNVSYFIHRYVHMREKQAVMLHDSRCGYYETKRKKAVSLYIKRRTHFLWSQVFLYNS